ncbi:MAG: hypothetical protein EPN43_06650 [Jatrophihabitans sp.]|nr:MAG: hypothetical protein EPN43_06650 [Jatrophihabitans sp.]
MKTPTSTSRLAARLRRADGQLTRRWAKGRLKQLAARAGFLVTRMDDEARRYVRASYNAAVPLPEGAEQTLRTDNPELVALQQAYDAMPGPATSPTQWDAGFLRKNLSLAWFRGDNAYVWQFRQARSAADARTYLQRLDIASRDRLGLLGTLEEDGLFGAWTFTFGALPPVSRDLLDSVNEINYLDAQMGLSTVPGLRVVDIGAGYGRLAHRMSTALPNLAAYDCIDGVAVSTFLCGYYVGFRALPATVRVIPAHRHDTLAGAYDLAVNIHSFAECSLETIRWWLERIAEREIEWLLIVPNTPTDLLSTELDGSSRDFMPFVLQAGYTLVDSRWTHESDELRELIGTNDRFFLFRRSAAQ